METNTYKLCFIISHKYYRNYTSYIQYYVDNVQLFYPNSLCIIVDNNSTHINDIIVKLKDYKNVIILTNVSKCKFELGAYKVGISYLINHDLLDKYDYTIFSQDTFILKNKYDFNELQKQNTTACPITLGGNELHYGMLHVEQSQIILKKINLLDSIEKIGLCWCNSFILHNSKIIVFFEITDEIIITQRIESEWSERYLAAILYYLNNYNNYTIIDYKKTNYNVFTINIFESSEYFFIKNAQQKNGLTIDL
jgi:hypothetical protein